MLTLRVGHVKGDKAWDEKFTDKTFDTDEAAWKWAQETLDNFNRTLRKGERARKLIAITRSNERPKHDWERRSLVTQSTTDGRLFDRMQCRHCSAAGTKEPLAQAVSTRLSEEYPRSATLWRCDEFDEKLRKHRATQEQRQSTRGRNAAKKGKK